MAKLSNVRRLNGNELTELKISRATLDVNDAVDSALSFGHMSPRLRFDHTGRYERET
jgi:hypothetical protein